MIGYYDFYYNIIKLKRISLDTIYDLKQQDIVPIDSMCTLF